MATKTQAAKVFAELYGTYNTRYGMYELGGRSTSSVTSTHEQYEKQTLKDKAEEQRLRAESAIADLKAIMRLLGVDKQYDDDVETQEKYVGPYYPYWTTRDVVTKTALQKFREDVRTVDKAADASAALDRLTGDTK